MPWVNRGRDYSGETSRGQKVLNVAIILAIVFLFLTIKAYRTSIDRMEDNVASLRAELSQTRDAGDPAPSAMATGAGIGAEDTAALRKDVSGIRAQVSTLNGDLETLASKAVDVRSMEALRDELLGTTKRMAEIEAELEALARSPREGGSTVSAEDIASALAQARVARAELKEFKAMLGYGDM